MWEGYGCGCELTGNESNARGEREGWETMPHAPARPLSVHSTTTLYTATLYTGGRADTD